MINVFKTVTSISSTVVEGNCLLGMKTTCLFFWVPEVFLFFWKELRKENPSVSTSYLRKLPFRIEHVHVFLHRKIYLRARKKQFWQLAVKKFPTMFLCWKSNAKSHTVSKNIDLCRTFLSQNVPLAKKHARLTFPKTCRSKSHNLLLKVANSFESYKNFPTKHFPNTYMNRWVVLCFEFVECRNSLFSIIAWFFILESLLFHILWFQWFFTSEELHLFFFASESWMHKNFKNALDKYLWGFFFKIITIQNYRFDLLRQELNRQPIFWGGLSTKSLLDFVFFCWYLESALTAKSAFLFHLPFLSNSTFSVTVALTSSVKVAITSFPLLEDNFWNPDTRKLLNSSPVIDISWESNW